MKEWMVKVLASHKFVFLKPLSDFSCVFCRWHYKIYIQSEELWDA